MSVAAVLQVVIIVLPVLALLLGQPVRRRTALTVCIIDLFLSLILLGLSFFESLPVRHVFILDELNVWLLPYSLIIYLAIFLCTPRAERSSAARTSLLIGLSLDLAFFSLQSSLAMAILWPLSHLPLFYAVKHRGGLNSKRLLRILCIYLIPGCLLFSLGSVALWMQAGAAPLWALLAVTAGIALRKAFVPLHQWLPELFDQGPLEHVIAFFAPQLGAYATVRLLAPGAPTSLLVGLGGLALLTSLYGACLAFGQKSVRGTFAGLVMGQTSLVFAGLQCTTHSGLAGGLALWLSGGLSLTGFGLAIWVLEARRGPLALNVYQGGHDLSPTLASCFLILGLSTVGFPGTLGFVAEELLLHGTTHLYPLIGILAAVTTTLNGITVLRVYFCMFCGARVPRRISQSLRLRERVAMLTLVALLLSFGLLPQFFVASRWRAAEAILVQRNADRTGKNR